MQRIVLSKEGKPGEERYSLVSIIELIYHGVHSPSGEMASATVDEDMNFMAKMRMGRRAQTCHKGSGLFAGRSTQ